MQEPTRDFEEKEASEPAQTQPTPEEQPAAVESGAASEVEQIIAQPEPAEVSDAESVAGQEPAAEQQPVAEQVTDTEPEPEAKPEPEAEPVPTKPEHRKWQFIYSITVTAILALCFGVLIGALLTGGVKGGLIGGFSGDINVMGGGDEQTIQVSALESVRNYTVVITAKTADGVSTGTGIVLTRDGYIATNYHVIEDATTIKVKMYNGTSAVASVVGFSEIDDLAVIKIQATGLYAATLASSAEVVDGQNVYAVGTPAGEEYAWSVTKGVVSYAQRDVKIYDDEGILVKKMKLIQTDTPVNPGNSGGPLVNSDGEVLGIVTLKLAGQYENMGFAIPIDGAMVLINNIIQTGEPGESPITTKRPLIGIVGVGVKAGTTYVDMGESISSDPEDIRKYPDQVFYAAHTGVLVKGTTPGLDAANKLQVGDIIVMADGQELETIYDLMDVINGHNGGETVELTYYRNGVANIVNVELGYAD